MNVLARLAINPVLLKNSLNFDNFANQTFSTATPADNSHLVIPLDGSIIGNMRFSSAFAVFAVVLGTAVLLGQTVSSPAARKAPTEYRLDDGIGAVAFYPGADYRSFVEARFMVSSLDELESQISQLQRGAALHWLPHRWDNSGNPILFASGQYEQFVRFCSDHGIQILIERTYKHHLAADGSYTRTVIAAGEKERTPIEFRSVVVHLASNAARNKKQLLRMLFDPKTKLFYWQNYDLYPGYAPEGDATLADQWLGVVYLGSHQMAMFKIGLGAELMIRVSTKRQNSLSQGQASAIRALEGKRTTPFQNSKFVTFWKQLPPDFFKQCMTDVYMPIIQSVQRQANRWQVIVAAQNGNIAVLLLDDSYNLTSTKVTLNPDADSVGGCKR